MGRLPHLQFFLVSDTFSVARVFVRVLKSVGYPRVILRFSLTVSHSMRMVGIVSLVNYNKVTFTHRIFCQYAIIILVFENFR